MHVYVPLTELALRRALDAAHPPSRRRVPSGGRPVSPAAHSLPAIIQAAASACNTPVPDIRSTSRKSHLILARDVITIIARDHFRVPFSQIAEAINRDRTTVSASTYPRAKSRLKAISDLVIKTIDTMETA